VPITLQAQNLTINGLGGILDSRNPTGAPVNRPPVWALPPTAVNIAVGSVASIAPYASDPDGDAITFSRVGGTAPAGLTVLPDGTMAVAAGTTPGTYTVLVDANDGRG
jgi:hypothetical protein